MVLGAEAVVREVAGDDHAVGLELVQLRDGAVEEARDEVRRPAVQVRDLRNRDGAVSVHVPSRLRLVSSRRSPETLTTPRSALLTLRTWRVSSTSRTRRVAAPWSTP